MQQVPVSRQSFGLHNAASAAGFAPACLFETSDEFHRGAIARWRRRRRLTTLLIAAAVVLAGSSVVIFVIL
jgi:hypothetical protein